MLHLFSVSFYPFTSSTISGNITIATVISIVPLFTTLEHFVSTWQGSY